MKNSHFEEKNAGLEDMIFALLKLNGVNLRFFFFFSLLNFGLVRFGVMVWLQEIVMGSLGAGRWTGRTTRIEWNRIE